MKIQILSLSMYLLATMTNASPYTAGDNKCLKCVSANSYYCKNLDTCWSADTDKTVAECGTISGIRGACVGAKDSLAPVCTSIKPTEWSTTPTVLTLNVPEYTACQFQLTDTGATIVLT